MSARGGWRKLLQIGVSAAAVFLMLRLVDFRAAAQILADARPGLVVGAIALYLAGQVLSAYRWRLIGSSVGLVDDLRRYVEFYFIGMFFMFFGPSTLGGDLVRALYLAGTPGRRARALNSVVLDRLNGLVVLIAIGAVAFVLFPQYELPRPFLYFTVATAAAFFLGWWLAPWVVARLFPPAHRLRRFVEVDLAPFWTDRAMLLGATVASVVFHLVQLAILFIVSRALHLDVPFSYIAVFHPLVSALSAIPITFSGIGLREGGYLFFLTHIGIAREGALAFGLLWLLVIIANSLIGGIVFLASGARMPALRS
jgi:uncharacterized membrane protein YbhN (UPF0104 family)